jgi:hypothetical protein
VWNKCKAGAGKNTYKFQSKDLNGTNHLGNLGRDGRVTVKWT